ncbi:Hint domain-containing protein [Jannaschia faecimaris]|uniref:Hint domain-containing protein n=1 Tax=Jannaschia faecimaris TaxID=1244108 RepID=A0A1H3LQI9_9RHOB|nr:Hint domain-containing protein [Jannaschia faecimaris]SDY66596.1 Hint domain-containing protein [Jannaschia faecimaris]
MTAYQRLPSASFSPVPGPDGDTRGAEVRTTASYDLAWVDHRGMATWDRRSLPDTPEVEAAVSSFARSAMLRGPRGPVAVEDLIPGDQVMVRGGGMARIDWIGSRSYSSTAERPMFYRVAARAFGASGPDVDILLGASAHVLIDSKKCVDLVGGTLAFAPISAFEDGHNVAAIVPPGEVTVYGIACRGQEAMLAAGLAIESYHPARATVRSLNRTVLADLAKLFPQTTGGAGFGAPRIPYLTPAEAVGLALAGV